MHFEDAPAATRPRAISYAPWWKELTRYQWFVFIVASLGWLFDTMDQQLFNLARSRRSAACSGSPPGDIDDGGTVD